MGPLGLFIFDKWAWIMVTGMKLENSLNGPKYK